MLEPPDSEHSGQAPPLAARGGEAAAHDDCVRADPGGGGGAAGGLRGVVPPRLATFYRFPREHWVHLRTTNIVEPPLAALRVRTDAAKRFTRVANATAVI
jgi:hypothetical protein